MKNLLYIVFFLACTYSNAQNLIQNGGFEEYYSCPQFLGDLSAKYWYSPNDNTPDYFNSCATDPFCSVPQNLWGFQYPQEGQGYGGAGTAYGSINNREYLTNKLALPLNADSSYCLVFYVCAAEFDTSGCLYDEIGIYFSPDSFFYSGLDTLPFQPQLETADGIFFNDTANWIKVELQFVATGGEKYMTIGNFKSNANTDTINLGSEMINYYYYDNFSLVECPPLIQPLQVVIPNVFTPNKDGLNDTFKIENLPKNSQLNVYSRWGNLVYQSNNYNNDWTGDNLSDGVYYYILTLSSGNSTKGTVTILRD